MSLVNKMLGRISKACGFRSRCRQESDQKYVDDLFAADWEVFVIKHDKRSGKFNTFTLCCDSADMKNDVKSNIFSAACC